MTSPAPIRALPSVPLPQTSHVGLRGAALACADLLTLSAAVGSGYLLWLRLNPAIAAPQALSYLVAPFSVAAFASAGLYPGIGITAVEHIRRSCNAITLAYLMVTASLFLRQEFWANSRGSLFAAWLLSLILVPLGRGLLSICLASQSWWSVPVVILGAGKTAQLVIRNLADHRVLGYRPIACFDDDQGKRGFCQGVPVLGPLSKAENLAAEFGAKYAIVAMPGIPRERLVYYLRTWSQIFPSILIVPNLFGVASLWTAPRDLGGVLGLEIRHNLLNPFNRWIKRALDITVALLGLVCAAPVLAIAALWIRKVSPGPVMYFQEREGKRGRVFPVFKLRTMYPNAEQMLKEYLEQNASARLEWARFCKLRKDCRILPGIGPFLRRTSLDELPQLWNVLKGDMSLVGPRPFPQYHNERFDPDFRSLRTQVTPGLTGLWQVSARSNGDLTVQASLDDYYIRNWSLWLDIYILIRTARAVIAPQGAY